MASYKVVAGAVLASIVVTGTLVGVLTTTKLEAAPTAIPERPANYLTATFDRFTFAYHQNDAIGDTRYKDKWVQIKDATVLVVRIHEDGYILRLIDSERERDGAQVSVALESTEFDKFVKLRFGDKVEVSGFHASRLHLIRGRILSHEISKRNKEDDAVGRN